MRLFGPPTTADETSYKYIFQLAAPMIVMHLSFTIMQFVDRFMVSRVGTDALAAILPAGAAVFVPVSLAMGSAVGITTYVSQSLGRGETSNCSNYCWQAIYMMLVYFLIVIAVAWPAAPLIFKLMGQPEHIIPMEVDYFRINLYGGLVGVFIWCTSQFFIGIHRPAIIMFSSIIGQIVNVAANYILIFGKFGLPALEVRGAAWGTFIGMLVGGGIRMYFYLSPAINDQFQTRTSMRLDLKKMKRLIKVGLPAGIELMINVALWSTFLFTFVGVFGAAALAASSATIACANVSIMPTVGLSGALSAAVGKAIGKNRKDIASTQTAKCLKIALTYMGLIGLIFLIFRTSIIQLWSDDPEVIEIGKTILALAAIYQIFHAARVVYSGALRGAGDTIWLALISLVGSVGVLGIGGLLITRLMPQLGAVGPWIVATLSIIVVGIANRRRFNSNHWQKIDLFAHAPIISVETDAPIE